VRTAAALHSLPLLRTARSHRALVLLSFAKRLQLTPACHLCCARCLHLTQPDAQTAARFQELRAGQHGLEPVPLPDGLVRTQLTEVFLFVAREMAKAAHDYIKNQYRRRRLKIVEWALYDALSNHLPSAAVEVAVEPTIPVAEFKK
jgi:hypothetical protein